MNYSTQHRRWIPGMRRRVASAALGLAILFMPALHATGSNGFIDSSASLTQTVNIVLKLISVTVTPSNSLLAVGENEQFIAYGIYSDGTYKIITSSVTWKSSKTHVATIVPGGLATGVAVGTTTIKAKSGKVSGSATLSVN